MMLNNNLTVRSVFLQSLGLIFLSANVSYYIQYPGLLGSSGITPVDHVFSKLFPSLQWLLLDQQVLDEDSFVDLLVLIGVFFSSLAVCGIVHCSVFFILTISYYVISSLGGLFYSFQWESLLLEVGALTTLCYAPIAMVRLSHGTNTSSSCSAHTAAGGGAWPLRFLLFKLMFMSGVVKLQADCPTWNHLTALEYHYASQCLPGPLAWHAHQLHPLFHRLSVAATLIIEIPISFLLLLPFSMVRRFGAMLQAFLQVLIIFTGNYNFFNLLTIILCLPCMELDRWNLWPSRDDNTKNTISESVKQHRWWSLITATHYIFCCLFTAFSAYTMFRMVRGSNNAVVSVSLTLTKEQCNSMVLKSMPIVISSTFIFMCMHVGIHAVMILQSQQGITSATTTSTRKQIFLLIVRGIMCSICIGVIAIPFLFLTPELQRHGFVGSEFFSSLWLKVQPYRISNSYGLFRRMTGVGRQPSSSGWGGLPPSVVARPEIIVEGIFVKNDTGNVQNGQQQLLNEDEEENEWKEIKFRWKPGGDLTKRPRQVAPHQPRLDWQMWFAALGTYQHNPWLVHFISKILDGCSPVLQLIDEPELLAGKTKILKIRATTWDYDFTRLPTRWNKRIPNVAYSTSSDCDHYFCRDIFRQPSQFWTRTNPREYLPPIQKGDADDYLVHHGFIRSIPQNPSGKNCYSGRDRCLRYKKSRLVFCVVTEKAREYKAEVLIPMLVFMTQLFFFFAARRKHQQNQTQFVGQDRIITASATTEKKIK